MRERERERERETDRQTETERHTEICEQIGLLIIHKKELRGNLYTCRERERERDRHRETERGGGTNGVIDHK